MAAPIPDHLTMALDSLSLHAFSLSTPKKTSAANKRGSGTNIQGTPRSAFEDAISSARKEEGRSPSKKPGIVTRLNYGKAATETKVKSKARGSILKELMKASYNEEESSTQQESVLAMGSRDAREEDAGGLRSASIGAGDSSASVEREKPEETVEELRPSSLGHLPVRQPLHRPSSTHAVQTSTVSPVSQTPAVSAVLLTAAQSAKPTPATVLSAFQLDLLQVVDLTADDEDALDELLDRQATKSSGSSNSGNSRRKGRVSVFGLVQDARSVKQEDDSGQRPAMTGSSSNVTLCDSASVAVSPAESPALSGSADSDSSAPVDLADELFPPSPIQRPSASVITHSAERSLSARPAPQPRDAARRITIVDLDSFSDSEDDDKHDGMLDEANLSIESATSQLRRTPPRRTSPGLTQSKPRLSEVLAEAADENSSGESDEGPRRTDPKNTRKPRNIVISDESEDDEPHLHPRREPRPSSSPESFQRRRSPRLSEVSDPGAGILEYVPTPKRPNKIAPLTPKAPNIPAQRTQLPRIAPPKIKPRPPSRGPFNDIPRSSSAPSVDKAKIGKKIPAASGPLSGRAFVLKRDILTATLVAELDALVFDKRLPSSLRVIWSKRLNTTAGRASWRRRRDPVTRAVIREEAEIELATKVVDDEQKLKNTLAHELCHVATFALDGQMSPPHGPAFKAWARRIHRARPDIEVTTTHSYQIEYRYKWQCLSPACGHIFGRHSKSIDPAKHGCHCGARLQALAPASKGKTSRETHDLVRAMGAIELE